MMDGRLGRLGRIVAVSALPAFAALAWDASGLDYPLARLAGDAHGFAARDDWLLQGVMHDGARVLAWALATTLCLAVWWPVGPLRRLPLSRRLQCALGVLAGVLVVNVAKHFSATHCPWDLTAFGGWATPDALAAAIGIAATPVAGHCFPAGHAAAGFAFVSGYFAFRGVDDRMARTWLAGALLVGIVLGLAQQWRGAHFMSHTLWSAVTCWWVAVAVDLLRHWSEQRWPHLTLARDV